MHGQQRNLCLVLSPRYIADRHLRFTRIERPALMSRPFWLKPPPFPGGLLAKAGPTPSRRVAGLRGPGNVVADRSDLAAVALVFAARTAVRNLDWLNAERFYTKLAETSPASAKSHYSIGVLRSAHGDDGGAIEAYDRAIAIFPAYAEAYRNRGNALARLGRREEAMASYRQCLRFDPTDFAANSNLRQLAAGLPVNPPRARL